MSTSSDKHSPIPNNHGNEQVIDASWDELAVLVKEADQTGAFAEWLEDELRELEASLDQFVTDKSRYSGRR